MKVQISGQYGDPKAWDIFAPMQNKINSEFDSQVTYAPTDNVTKLSIGLRVSGDIQDFESRGIELLKYIKKHKAITVDLVYSKEDWKEKPQKEIKESLTRDIRKCLNTLISKALNMGEDFNELKLNSEIDSALSSYLTKETNENP